MVVSRRDSYNQIQEINENINTDRNDEQLLTPDEDYPISVLDKNSGEINSKFTSDIKTSYKEELIDIYSSSTGPVTFGDRKKSNLFGNEYIQLNSNEFEDIEKNQVGRLHSESSGNKEKNDYQDNHLIEI